METFTMSAKKWIILAGSILLILYLGVGTLLTLRYYYSSKPKDQVVELYLEAIKQRDAETIYRCNHKLAPHLSIVLTGSSIHDQERQELYQKEYSRWLKAFTSNKKTSNSMHRERQLITPDVEFTPTDLKNYKIETGTGRDINLVSYKDIENKIYNFYYQLIYPSKNNAPKVSVLGNIKKKKSSKIKSVVMHFSVFRQQKMGLIKTTILEWEWLDDINFLFPTSYVVTPEHACHTWSVEMSLDVDKLTLETF
jgi:hypothetical protein